MPTARSLSPPGAAAVRWCLRAGASNFIVKPVHSAALLKKMARVVPSCPNANADPETVAEAEAEADIVQHNWTTPAIRP